MGHSIRTHQNRIVTRITEHITRLHERIETAADRAGRDPQAITIVAVSKKHPVSAMREAFSAGLTQFGENYVQEALPKIAEFTEPVEWHFIGKAQSNKAAAIAGSFDWIHTVASTRLARRLSSHRPDNRNDLQVCIQLAPDDVDELSGDRGDNRAGIASSALPKLAELIEELPKLHLRGLMMMPLPGLDPTALSHEFARARTLFDDLNCAGHNLDTLSMGMSGDLETAIMQGSTLIRVGTDIFGPRTYD